MINSGDIELADNGDDVSQATACYAAVAVLD